MQGLTVVDAYTTENPDSSSNGAITLVCKQDGTTITIRTAAMKDENGNLITQDLYLGKTIDVKGIVDYFDGTYPIKVFPPENITIK
jgi:DNA/RNA endonuclease YhcR with UshA esterase domain